VTRSLPVRRHCDLHRVYATDRGGRRSDSPGADEPLTHSSFAVGPLMRPGMGASILVLAAALLVGGCAHAPPRPPAQVSPFSAASPGNTYPGGWRELGFARFRKPTKYALVDSCGTTVVEASADGSSSGLAEPLDVDPHKYPWLIWRWKVPHFIPGVDNTRRETDDAPARLEVSFDGDMKKVPFEDRLFFAEVKALTGLDMPYATLEYVWGDGAPRETVIINTWTSRIRMLIIEIGAERTGEWVTEKRNVYEDYRRAYGEEPGRITAIAVLTDTDATREKATAYYGDIAFLPTEPANGGRAESAPAPGETPSPVDRPEGLDCPAPGK
jgi:hypothetical protein